MDVPELRRLLRTSKEYNRTVEVFTNLRESFDYEKFQVQVIRFQEERARRPKSSLYRLPKEKLKSYASEDSAYRSRVVYIQMITRKLSYQVRYLTDNFIDWIIGNYGSQMKGTITERRLKASQIASPMSKFLNSLDALDELCALVSDDIDQSKWSRKAITDVLEIETRPESNI